MTHALTIEKDSLDFIQNAIQSKKELAMRFTSQHDLY